MIPKIQTSKQFVEDYKQYQERILKISDVTVQNELAGILVKLKEYLTSIAVTSLCLSLAE